MHEPAAQPTPSTFVTVVAWIFIVLGGLATLIAIMQNAMIQMMFDDTMRANLEHQPPPEGMPSIFVTISSHIEWVFVGFLLVCLATFVSAVGLLRRRNWARRIFICVMSLGVLWNLGSTLFTAVLMGSMMPPDLPADPRMESMLVINVAIGLAFAGLFGWIAYRLMTPDIRREFS